VSFLAEIRRRKVFQVAAVYAVVAWLIIQIVATIEQPLQLPEWFDTVAIVLLAMGFPITLIASWAFDVTPQGVVRDHGLVRSKGRGIEYVLIGLLVVAVGWIAYRESSLSSTAGVLPNSIAVLPCDNFSPSPDNAYFAPGFHVELLNQLAKIRDLNVIARKSVLQYADAARSITDIARELDVGSVMECSVSYAEGRVAIAAQLSDAATGVSLWSNSYNREFANVFDIQADIATAIAVALEAELMPEERRRIEIRPTLSLDAYAAYLQAMEILATTACIAPDMNATCNVWFEGESTLENVRDFLDEAISLDDQFALAYAQRAGVSIALTEAPDVTRAYAERAVALDSNLGWPYALIGNSYRNEWQIDEARTNWEKAYQLSPNDPEILKTYGLFLSYVGEHDQALELQKRALDLDPEGGLEPMGLSRLFARDFDGALEAFHREIEIRPLVGYMLSGHTELLRNNYGEALANFRLAERLLPDDAPFLALMPYYYSRAGSREDAQRTYALWETLRQRQGLFINVSGRVLPLLGIGNREQALAEMRRALETRERWGTGDVLLKFNLYGDPILDEPEFTELRRQLWFLN